MMIKRCRRVSVREVCEDMIAYGINSMTSDRPHRDRLSKATVSLYVSRNVSESC